MVERQSINLSKINPQIDGFDDDIYNQNLKINVFDPYFYQVMMTRFYFYAFEIQSTQSKPKSKKSNQSSASTDNKETICIINNIYDENNFQEKASEFFSMIQMPDKDTPEYKEALVRLFTLTIFEPNYNYTSSWCKYNNKICRRYVDIDNDPDEELVSKTFLKYFLEDSKYKNDFANLVKSDDLNNLEIPFSEITYLFPQSVTKAFGQVSPNPLEISHYWEEDTYVKTCFYDTDLFKLENEPNYNDKTLAKITIKNLLCSFTSQNWNGNYYCHPMFMYHRSIFSSLWNIFHSMKIHQLTLNGQVYYPRVVHSQFSRHQCFYDEDRYQLLDKYSQHLGNKIIADMINGGYIYPLVGYLFYKDDIELTKSTIYSLALSLNKNDLQVLIKLVLGIVTRKDYYLGKKKINNIDENIGVILEVFATLTDKIAPRNAYTMYNNFLKAFYKKRPSYDIATRKQILNLCNALNKQALSIF